MPQSPSPPDGFTLAKFNDPLVVLELCRSWKVNEDVWITCVLILHRIEANQLAELHWQSVVKTQPSPHLNMDDTSHRANSV
jgi:type II secretory pathway component PulL